jgi:hypothetical protein
MEPASPPSWLGFVEFFVVLLFALGWGVLELVCRRMDRRRKAARSTAQDTTGASAGREQ